MAPEKKKKKKKATFLYIISDHEEGGISACSLVRSILQKGKEK